MKITELVSYLNKFLNIDAFHDYAPNGLQISGKDEINHVVLGVSISQQLIDYASKVKADAILVHHGFFWKGEDSCIIGMKNQRIKTILLNDINLLSYHLPLDAHIKIGNNAQLAERLLIKNAHPVDESGLLWVGNINLNDYKSFINNIVVELNRNPVVINEELLVNFFTNKKELYDENEINQEQLVVAWCTGAAQDSLLLAKSQGAMVYISGEISERNYYEAYENDICYISAGHYATEQFGIQALGEHLKDNFEITSEFFYEKNII